MIIKWRNKEARKRYREEKLRNWNKHFAIIPVRLDSERVAFLETILRRRVEEFYGNRWEYKESIFDIIRESK